MAFITLAITNNEATTITLDSRLGGAQIAAAATKTLNMDAAAVLNQKATLLERCLLAEVLENLQNAYDVTIVIGTTSLQDSVPSIQEQLESAVLRAQLKGVPIVRGGTATFAAAATSAVVLDPPMPSANYRVVATPGFAPASLNPPFITTKTAAGFTIAFAAGQTGDVDWILVAD